jgi:hypothetical protein
MDCNSFPEIIQIKNLAHIEIQVILDGCALKKRNHQGFT